MTGGDTDPSGPADIDPRDLREPWAQPDTDALTPASMMAFIRARCPWARAHTHRSLVPYLLEETVELMAALVEDEASTAEDPGANDAVEAELADVLYQVVFHAALIDDRRGREPGTTWGSLQERIVGKYVRRHPHVFDSAHPVPLDEVQRRYQQVKAEEKEQRDAVSEPSAASHRRAADRALSVLSEIRGTMDDRNRQD